MGLMGLMGLLDIFKKPPPIREVEDLADFIDDNAAFVTQKGIYEYSRARAGHYAKVLFSEPTFLDAIEQSRWRAYPIGLAMVGEMADGVVHALPDAGNARLADPLRAIVLSVFDRYPLPVVLEAAGWQRARAELDDRLRAVSEKPRKRSFEIPDQYARAYFDLMPIDEKLRARDFPTMHNYMRLTLCNMHTELTKRIDGPALLRSLAG